jgi:thiamine pyrophosphokinase
VILAAGDFPTHPVPLQALREADFVVCCDSAYGTVKNARLEMGNYMVVGDGDSLSEADKKALGSRWIEVDEQDYNDLHKAMEYATKQFTIHNSQFTIIGATGKREDHTIGNISYLVTFAEEYPGADIEMLTDYGRFVSMTGSRTFASFPQQQVSIFTMDPDKPIYSEGLRWPLDNFHARRWWQASLNEALGSERRKTAQSPTFEFSLRTEGHLVVFQTYEPKS